MLKAATQAFIAELEVLAWFAHVSAPIDDSQIARVFTWKEALKHCRSRYSANVQMESKNLLTERLCLEHSERYQHWNKIVKAVKTKLLPIVEQKTKEMIKGQRLPKAFRDAVDWDLLCICMELEYADLVPPRFFAERAKWYLAGHFPCGWEGDFPIGGQLVVF